jgi:hypothetical protein
MDCSRDLLHYKLYLWIFPSRKIEVVSQHHTRSIAVVTVESDAAQARMATCTRAVRRRSEAAWSRQLVAGDNSGQTETSNDTRESRLVY